MSEPHMQNITSPSNDGRRLRRAWTFGAQQDIDFSKIEKRMLMGPDERLAALVEQQRGMVCLRCCEGFAGTPGAPTLQPYNCPTWAAPGVYHWSCIHIAEDRAERSIRGLCGLLGVQPPVPNFLSTRPYSPDPFDLMPGAVSGFAATEAPAWRQEHLTVTGA